MMMKMVVGSTPDYERRAELKAFDDTKTGVKGLVDAGIIHIPRMFLVPTPQNEKISIQTSLSKTCLPTINLKGINENMMRRKEVIKEVKDALETWGFFQMVNHGIPDILLEEMKKGVKAFFDTTTKAPFPSAFFPSDISRWGKVAKRQNTPTWHLFSLNL
ncbi:2-oxoglutarate (2OG) and Fe(II)-dependent oxygenase superfamily protein [Tanacetum coccineum]|uniref:2-oxoglutarate (2OG) and Fe(II)-dependent oxygenase superfamily protein n=1 Tax=Tanacetum coccineum TaxID=301880 RepID=A0ABQ5FS87_9ASTR